MHKFILKFFNFLKNSAHFLKVIVMFSFFMFFIFWMQNIIGANWSFLNFIKPYFNFFLNIGTNILNGKIQVLNTYVEYKYLAVIIIFIALYILAHILYLAIEKLEDIYDDSRRIIKEKQEASMNKALQETISMNEKKLKQYKIYIAISVKKNFAHSKYNINLEEESKNLNKFIIEKTSVNPIFHNEGFLYSFSNFESIDKVLDIFKKILNTESPLNYYICVQIYGANQIKENQELENLIAIKIPNKIIMMADTSYRYNFNSTQKYKTGQFGIYQKNGESFEVHIFDVE